MKLYALRHGQAQHNRRLVLNDDPATPSDLTSKGRAQAEAAAEQLKDKPLERIFTSELPRAVQTANIINQHHHVKQTADKRLNELKTGFHGRSVWAWVSRRILSRDDLHRRYNEGETLAEAKLRVESFLNELKQTKHQCVLVVAHQHTLQTLSSLLDGHSYNRVLRRRVGHTFVLEFEL
jgi:broad specificity phosphatase PhoE